MQFPVSALVLCAQATLQLLMGYVIHFRLSERARERKRERKRGLCGTYNYMGKYLDFGFGFSARLGHNIKQGEALESRLHILQQHAL